MKSGLGIRPELFESVLNEKPGLGFLEAHSENYFQPSIGRAQLMELRDHYPISLHGVGLSLGRADKLDQNHLSDLKRLVDDIEPIIVSEHLAWSAYSHRHLPDLLPLPLTEEAFETVCTHIAEMQDYLQRQILLENPSNYLLFDEYQIDEPEFMNAIANETGCGLLLDINNIHVSATNLGRESSKYLRAIDSSHIKQYHLAGYIEMQVGEENLLIDTHNQPVYPEVWHLYDLALKLHGTRPTIFEWDSDFPAFEVLIEECEKADKAQASVIETIANAETIDNSPPKWAKPSIHSLAELQSQFLDQVIGRDELLGNAAPEHAPRVWVYQNNTFGATLDYLSEVYPATKGVVGEQFFRQMCQQYVQDHPPEKGNIYYFGGDFASVLPHFEGLQGMPYLQDLLAYEWAQHCAYFAETGSMLNPVDIPQEELLQLSIRFNNSVWFKQCDFPIHEIHRQSLPSYAEEIKIDLGQSQDSLLVFKQGYTVYNQIISNEHAIFLAEISESENLLQAIEQLSGSLLPEVLSSALALIFQHGLLVQTN